MSGKLGNLHVETVIDVMFNSGSHVASSVLRGTPCMEHKCTYCRKETSSKRYYSEAKSKIGFRENDVEACPPCKPGKEFLRVVLLGEIKKREGEIDKARELLVGLDGKIDGYGVSDQ